MKKFVYYFGEGTAKMKQLLGSKGANLSEMKRIGIPVPPGFTITTDVCELFYKNKHKVPEIVHKEVTRNLKRVEKEMKAVFGNPEAPLLFSVRSGAAVSMPGMMDTVLNLGLNDSIAEGLARKTGNQRLAYDAYRRLLHMFGSVVMGIEHREFEQLLQIVKEKKGVKLDTELNAEELKGVVKLYKELISEKTGKVFPSDPRQQLNLAIDAVFSSWNTPRAKTYRRLNNIAGLKGTAVNVQAMVFGNMGDDSGTGVCFSRNPATGENKFYGEYLMNAQGEDVVAGIRTPLPIIELKKQLPRIYAELVRIYKRLEEHYKEMQDMEFTIQEGRLYMLQTRTGKRTAKASVTIAVDMANSGLIDKKTAVLRVEPSQLKDLLHKQIDPAGKLKAELIARGLPASPGAAIGRVAFTAERAVEMAQTDGVPVILVRAETSPEDIEGMNTAQGILTEKGGMTSHAAVVARGMGKCCVAGCSDIRVDEHQRQFKANDIVIREGDTITMDGSTGEVFKGEISVIEPELSGDFKTIMKWADMFRKLKVRANAETPNDTKVALDFGAEGIGLCRTEHMFFEADRIMAVREMIIASNSEARKKALSKILEMQKKDFVEIYEIMKGLPVTIRLLDPPLHEFLPKEDKDIEALAQEMKVSFADLKSKVEELHELNPMLGLRGCRLCIAYPEIAEMQTTAIMEAACELNRKGNKIRPEIMVPLVGYPSELKIVKDIIDSTAQAVMKKYRMKFKYYVGTMIEVPRAALVADQIAEFAEFFSFGTNDLTQMTLGFSRDDAGKFLPDYLKQKVFEKDPFQVLDQEGVGQLIRMSVEKGRKARKDLKVGICGEHGGEPSAVIFCHSLGMNYVSCSPFRVPVARLAAAHAALKN